MLWKQYLQFLLNLLPNSSVESHCILILWGENIPLPPNATYIKLSSILLQLHFASWKILPGTSPQRWWDPLLTSQPDLKRQRSHHWDPTECVSHIHKQKTKGIIPKPKKNTGHEHIWHPSLEFSTSDLIPKPLLNLYDVICLHSPLILSPHPTPPALVSFLLYKPNVQMYAFQGDGVLCFPFFFSWF